MSGPDFHIPGEPEQILARAARLRRTGERLEVTGEALKGITAEGWQGLAGDDFRAAFDSEPKRWLQAGDGFTTAAWALEQHAKALEIAQRIAAGARRRWHRGNKITEQARAEYAAARQSAHQRDQHETYETGQVVTRHSDALGEFTDPGEEVRREAVAELGRARQVAEVSSSKAARIVREACVHAPAKQNWLEKAGSASVSLVEGAYEAWAQMRQMLAPVMVGTPDWFAFWGKEAYESVEDPEEKAAQNRLRRQAVTDTATGLAAAAREDPVGLAKQIGYSAADIDTWKDDPARAVGHLVPDTVQSVATGGAATAATRGLRVARVLGDTARGTRGLLRGDHLGMVEGLAAHADEATDTTAVLGRHTDDLTVPHAPDFAQAPREHLYRPDPAHTDPSPPPHDQPAPGTHTAAEPLPPRPDADPAAGHAPTGPAPDAATTRHATGEPVRAPDTAGHAADTAARAENPAQARRHDTPAASPHEAARADELVSTGVGARHADDATISAAHASRFIDDAAASAGTAGRYADEADAEPVPASPQERAQAAYERFARELGPTPNTPRVDDVPVTPRVDDAPEVASRAEGEGGGSTGERFLTTARGEDVAISPETATTAALAGGGLAAGAAGLGIRAATRAGRHVDDVADTATDATCAADRAGSGVGRRLPEGVPPHGPGPDRATGTAAEADFPPGYDLHDPRTWSRPFNHDGWHQRLWADLPSSVVDRAYALGARVDEIAPRLASAEDLDRYRDALARVPRPEHGVSASGLAGGPGQRSVEVTLPNGKRAWLEEMSYGQGERWVTRPPLATGTGLFWEAEQWADLRRGLDSGFLRPEDFADYDPPLPGRQLHTFRHHPQYAHSAGVPTAWQRPEEVPDHLYTDPDAPPAEVDRLVDPHDLPGEKMYAPDADMMRVMGQSTNTIDVDMSKISVGTSTAAGTWVESPVWRRTLELLFRVSGDSPAHLAEHGFIPRTTEGDLGAYVGSWVPGPFISTSKSLDIVAQHASPGERKWVHIIDAPGGMDVNPTLGHWPERVTDPARAERSMGMPSPDLHAEHEVVHFGIRRERYVGSFEVEWDEPGKFWRPTNWVANPNYEQLHGPPDLPFEHVRNASEGRP